MLKAKPSQKNLPIKVGFDLDGVLLYNPVRNFRPIISFFKKFILGKKKTTFFVPKTRWQQLIFIFLHKSSLWISPGLAEIKALKRAGIIEPYLITARYSFLKNDLEYWLKKMQAETIFLEICSNIHDEQPFEFKAKQIKRLKLEAFVEDNWDIVMKLESLVKPNQPNFICWWVSNILDWRIDYKFKTSSVLDAVKKITVHYQAQSRIK